MSVCNICAEKFNKTFRAIIKCSCDFECCRACVKTYIMDRIEDASCMSCKIVFGRQFMADNFEKTFMNNNYKVHRENILFEREMGMLEATQPHVENQIKMDNIMNQIKELNAEYQTLLNTPDKQLQKREFIRKCPNSNCHGFLSSSLKCALCEYWACGKCRELIGNTSSDKDNHICNEEILENVKFMEKDSKPCPKCSSMISKVSGCFKKNTSILMWDQSTKMSQDIKIGDVLIGDNGEPRTVNNICSGEDNMYEVAQNNGEKYVVNSKHTLVLKTVGIDDKIVEILVEDYMRLSNAQKNKLVGYKSQNGINYPEQEIELDPYILGLWLGDGTHTLPVIASEDIEIQKYVLDWCKNNDAELIHDEAVKFRIRRKGKTNGISNLRNPIGQSNSETCKGCTFRKMEICDIVKNDNREVYKNKTNPFMNNLRKYNLVGNKHIPKEYMMNSREVRLKLLAGLIDTDGSASNNGKRISIGQVNKNLSDQIATLARSLGYVVNRRTVQRKNVKCPGVERKDYKDNHIISMSSENLSDIPTILLRKLTQNSNTNKDYQKTSIIVKSIGRSTYYGWIVNDNHRFVLNDFTVVKNCDQMYCIECHTAFSWKTLRIETGVIHNPHFFEIQRFNNNGIIPRNPLDIQCGREIDNNFVAMFNITFKNPDLLRYCNGICRHIIHMRMVEQPRFRVYDRFDNLHLRISFMRNKINKEEFKKIIQKNEKDNQKNTELRNLIVMYILTMTDLIYRLNDNINSFYEIVEEINALRKYTNDYFIKIGNSYNSKKYFITTGFSFV